MSKLAARSTATVIPCLRYRNAPAAIDWLCEAFGFERLLVVPGEGGTIAHAQLTFGNGMIMLGSVDDSAYGRLMAQPDEHQGRVTQSICVTVTDADAHHDRALSRGAEVVRPLKTEEYGGRGYGCRDIEGHLWYFGTYDPWVKPE